MSHEPLVSRVVGVSLLMWAFASWLGWLWWWNLKHGTIYVKGSRFKRKTEPNQYWFWMAARMIAAGVLAYIGGWFMLDAFAGR